MITPVQTANLVLALTPLAVTSDRIGSIEEPTTWFPTRLDDGLAGP